MKKGFSKKLIPPPQHSPMGDGIGRVPRHEQHSEIRVNPADKYNSALPLILSERLPASNISASVSGCMSSGKGKKCGFEDNWEEVSF